MTSNRPAWLDKAEERAALASASSREVVLRACAIEKSYSPTNVVLRGVNLDLAAGSIHGLLGANGAGKSTLIKVLCGLEQATAGDIRIQGVGQVRFAGPSDAERAGIGVVHQELPLLPNLTAAENMVLGQQLGGWLRTYRRQAVMQEYQRQAAMFPGAPFGGTRLDRVGLQGWQLIAIIRARYLGSRVMILDEPTSSLSLGERQVLHENLRRVAREGVAILYVSHFLDDVLSVCDTVTVLRDGQVALNCAARGLSHSDLLGAMTGEASLSKLGSIRAGSDLARCVLPGLRLRRMYCNNRGPSDFSVAPGERVGLYGLEGAGSREILEAIFGLRPYKGEVSWRGRTLQGDSSRRIIFGLGFVSGDRSRTLIGDWTLAQNHALPTLAVRSAIGSLRQTSALRSAERSIRRLDIKGTPRQRLKELSGGNQQKVALGRWLDGSNMCILADDPTRGVDVRGRRAIHETLAAFCADGNSLLVSSTDPEELVELCDRVLVIVDGRVVEELSGETLVTHRLEAATRTRCAPPGVG